MTDLPAPSRPGMRGHYAGAISRFVAYAIDVGVSSGLFTLGLAGVTFAVSIVTGHSVTFHKGELIVTICYVVWVFAYFAYSWGAFGKTIGMALLGVRVVRSNGADLDARRATVRTLAFPLSFLIFGLGFAGILVQRDRRALHDLIAGTAVVYSWDARVGAIRLLSRR
jgi:uncharacterized RDD family membrane protein YckC